MLAYFQLAAGLIYLLLGGDLLVRGAVALARRARVPPVVVALSVVAFGTSLPELVVSIEAATTGYPGLVLGNVVGSNIANVLLVGGVTAIVFPLRMTDQALRRTGTSMLLVSLLFGYLCVFGGVTRFEGTVLLVGFATALASTARAGFRAHQAGDPTTPLEYVLGLPQKLLTILLFIALGLVFLPLGARLLVEAAVVIATDLGVSETVVGLSIVAIGTSLPEVATTVVAAMQRRTGMAAGTIIGSNSFNILGIMGISAAFSAEPVFVSTRFLLTDLPVMLASSALLVAFAWMRRPLVRQTGLVFVAAYVSYLGLLYLTV